MGGCGGWSAVPFFCLKPVDFVSHFSFQFSSFIRSSRICYVFRACMCRLCVVAREFWAIISMVALCQGGVTFGAERYF